MVEKAGMEAAAASAASSSSRIVCASIIPCSSVRPGPGPGPGPAAVFLQSSYHTPLVTTKKSLLNSGLQKTCCSLPLKEKLEEAFPSYHFNVLLRKLWQQSQSLVMSYGNWWAHVLHLCKGPVNSVVDVHCMKSFVVISRRSCIVSLLMVGVGERTNAIAAAPAAAEGLDPRVDLELEPFTDKKEGFRLLKPARWSKVSKAGATVLFEDPITKSNNLGVIISPVKISSLQKFGSSQDVARKLIEAEQKKPSTNAASLIAIKERQLSDNIPLYQYEYKLDSSRGMKRVFAAVTIASKKLYIVNVAYTDNPETSLSPYVSEKLQAIVASFDLLH